MVSEPLIDLKIGHVLDVLRGMPERSVHCCVTSPPYWGLREYGTKLQIWDGDSACRHRWGKQQRGKRKDIKPGEETTSKSRIGQDDRSGKAGVSGGRFCERCGAWKGEHGHEPTPELWVKHEVAVYREVRRVLRDDGTLWVVVGDCYNAGRDGGWPGGKTQWKDSRYQLRSGPNVPGLKPKDRVTLGWDLFKALQADGWYGRQPIVWAKGVSFLEAWAGAVFPDSVNGWRWERHRVKIEKAKRGKKQGYSKAGKHRDHGHGGIILAPGPQWRECPGCPKCEANDGLVLRRGAWRPTSSYELVLMMSKKPIYYCDKYAVTEKCRRDTSGQKERKIATKGERQCANTHLGSSVPWKDDGTGRNLRSVWCIGVRPTKLKHFAVFPPDLVRPVIRAATSEAGVCPACGAPWARVVSVGRTSESGSGRSGREPDGKLGLGMREHQSENVGDGLWKGPTPWQRTLGWRPTCGCDAGDAVPATVLDPFCGSGTTLQVCFEEGRVGVGIDLDPASREHLETRLAEARECVRVRDAMAEEMLGDEPEQLLLEEYARGGKQRAR